MISQIGWLYVGGVTLLFFFWAYGIVSFGLDLKNRILPGIRQYLRGRRVRKAQDRQEEEREEHERQLY